MNEQPFINASRFSDLKSRIDACIVGDPNACLEPNESCQVEKKWISLLLQTWFLGRKKSSDICKKCKGAKAKVLLFL